jgi:hypothetical protein
LALDAKGGEREYVDSRELREGFGSFVCATFMHHVYFFALALYDICAYEILL